MRGENAEAVLYTTITSLLSAQQFNSLLRHMSKFSLFRKCYRIATEGTVEMHFID